MGRIEVKEGGFLTTVQDAGRFGFEHIGITVGGWLDDVAAHWANRLLHNLPGAPLLEVTAVGPKLLACDPLWLSLAGADLGARVNGVPWLPGRTWHLSPGDEVSFAAGSGAEGLRAYLGVGGGVHVPPVLGSCSTDLMAGFGGLRQGQPLRAGDVIRGREGPGMDFTTTASTACLSSVLRVMPGPRDHRFPPDCLTGLQRMEFRVTPDSNRMGIRLKGQQPLARSLPASGVSEGMAMGSIEVPPSGEPMVLMKARGTIGGYPVLATVISADWPVLAQLRPGQAIRFAVVDAETAARALDERCQQLKGDVKPLIPGGPVAIRAPVEGWWDPWASRALGRVQAVTAGQVLGYVRGFGESFAIEASVRGALEWKNGGRDGVRVAQGDVMALLHPAEETRHG